MEKIIIKGRPTFGGIAEGEAVVCYDSIAGNSGAIGDTDGVIHEKGSSNKGISLRNTILVIPYGKGSTGFSAHMKSAKFSGICPAGWVIKKMDSRLGAAVVSLGVPAVSDFEEDDPMEVIKSGDWVKIDGDSGIVEITRK